jgi:heme/copper-type cytochrome/quinol oxidase subunit 3
MAAASEGALPTPSETATGRPGAPPGAHGDTGAGAPSELNISPEPADVGARGLSVAARLLCGASTFFFLAFVFAYFYLRSLNQDHMWRPSHVKPDQGLGIAFVVCLVLSVGLTAVSSRQIKLGRHAWTVPALGGLLFGLAAVGVQCIEYTVQHFGPTNGAYASVFCAWTAFYLMAALSTMYWLETQLATELRARREPAHSHGDIADPDELIAPGLHAVAFFWTYLGALGVLMYVVLYPLQ